MACEKQSFCEQFRIGFYFYGTGELRWFDLTGIYKFQNSEIKLAKIELSENGIKDQFDGFRVSIINTNTGVIDSKFFRFNDYLITAKDRSSGEFKVTSYLGWDWDGDKPYELHGYAVTISEYVLKFM